MIVPAALALLLPLSASAAPVALSPTATGKATAPQLDRIAREEQGKRLIATVLKGNLDSIAPFFEDSVRASLTPENIKTIQGQINWLYGMIGGGFELFMSGTRVLPDGETAFFREYRIASEIDKRAPLILVHVWYKDSTARQAAGMLVKNFADNAEKRIAGAQTWRVGDQDVDVQSVVVVKFQSGSMMAVKVFDDDTAAMDRPAAAAKAAPILREAVARGLLKQAQAGLEGDTLLDNVGIAFLRKDPHLGYGQLKYGFTPEEFGDKSGTAKAAHAAPTRKKTATKPAKAAKK